MIRKGLEGIGLVFNLSPVSYISDVLEGSNFLLLDAQNCQHTLMESQHG